MKREELYRYKYRSEKEFRARVDEYVNFYNCKRPHKTLKYKTPEQVEQKFLDAARVWDLSCLDWGGSKVKNYRFLIRISTIWKEWYWTPGFVKNLGSLETSRKNNEATILSKPQWFRFNGCFKKDRVRIRYCIVEKIQTSGFLLSREAQLWILQRRTAKKILKMQRCWRLRVQRPFMCYPNYPTRSIKHKGYNWDSINSNCLLSFF